MKNGHIKIDKGIPVPPRRNANGYTALIRSLKKGDSVLLPVKIQTAVSLCYQISDDRSMYTRRSEGTSVRVWRVK